jgi:hypothetical protein
VRFRFALAVMVAGMLFAAGIASAQSTTQTSTDESLSGYTNTSTTKTQKVAPTATSAPAPATEGQEADSVAPAVAAQSAPDNLAFTGGEPLLLIALGLALAGGTATLLVRDRRRGSQNQ